MSESELLIRVGASSAAAVVGLGAFLWGLRWAEDRGYVYGYRNKPKPGGVTHAALEAERLLARPSVEHRVEADDARVERADNDGD